MNINTKIIKTYKSIMSFMSFFGFCQAEHRNTTTFRLGQIMINCQWALQNMDDNEQKLGI